MGAVQSHSAPLSEISAPQPELPTVPAPTLPPCLTGLPHEVILIIFSRLELAGLSSIVSTSKDMAGMLPDSYWQPQLQRLARAGDAAPEDLSLVDRRITNSVQRAAA
eukprot:7312093-Prymnesium_polylepis.1